MTAQLIKGHRKTWLAAWVMFGALLVSTTVPASGRPESGRGIRTPAGAVSDTRSKKDRHILAAERARVSAFREKRDPFKVPHPPSPGAKGDLPEVPLPPGSRGLVIGAIQLKGIVREEDTDEMIAVVTNRANLAYFLHVHDQVYNGVVQKITPDSVYFKQDIQEADGKLSSREVVLKLNSGR